LHFLGQPCEFTLQVEAAREAMWAGLAAVRPGPTVGVVGAAIEAVAAQHGLSSVRVFVGHGISRGFHEGPKVGFGRVVIS
jgi:methionyl aminopeptidase